MSRKTHSGVTLSAASSTGYAGIRSGIVELLDAARHASYGEASIERLASDRTQRFGRDFSRQNLQQMRSSF